MAPLDTYDVQRFVQLALFGGGIVLFLCVGRDFSSLSVRGTEKTVLLCSLLCMTIGAMGSISISPFPFWSLLDLLYQLHLVGVGLILFFAFRSMDEMAWHSFGGCVVLLMGGYALYAVLEIVIAAPMLTPLAATPGFSNIRMFSDVAVVLLPLSWLAINKNILLRMCVWGCGIVWFWLLIITEGRSGILSLLIAAVWVCILYGALGRKALARLLVMAALAAAIYIFLPVMATNDGLGWHRDISSSSGRLELWLLSWHNFIAEFPYGIGGMMFAADGRSDVAHPHNIIFIIMAEWGGLFLFGVLLAMLVVFCRAIKQRKERRMRMPVAMAAVAAGVNIMFSGAQSAPFSAVCLVLVWGGYMATVFPESQNQEDAVNVEGWTVLLLFIWLIICWMGYSLYGYSKETRLTCLQENGVVYPRFWAQGRLDCGLEIP